MKPSEILQSAKEIISSPDRLSYGWYARDSFGNSCSVEASYAQSWCMWGALMRVCSPEPTDETSLSYEDHLCWKQASQSLNSVVKAHGFHNIASFNDGSDWESIQQMWDRAIEYSKEHYS